MATPEKLLSTKNGEKADTIDANKEDKKVQDVGGPESDWSTAQYANFKFDATLGVSPDSTILGKAKVDAEDMESLKEGEECPVCEQTPCTCESLKETEHEDETEDKKDLSEADDEEEKAEDEAEAEVEDDEEAKAEDEAEADDTLELDLSDLIDGEEDAIELKLAKNDDEEVADEVASDEEAADDEVAPEETEEDYDFAPSDDDKTWADEEDTPAVEVEDEVEDEVEEEKEASEDDEAVEEAKSEDDEDEDEEDAEKVDEDKAQALTMGEGKFKLTFKSTEVAKLFENNTVLTEDDKRQSRVLFESAIRTVAKQMGAQLKDAYQARYIASKKQYEAKVAKQVDAYMSYVVEQWVKDNKVALQHQLRNRLTESFINGFKKLCTEHYIDVPQSRVNVVQTLAKNVKSLKTRLKESEAKSVKLHEEAQSAIKRERIALRKEHKARLIAEAAGAVTAANRGEFKQRAETVKFTTTKEFKKDLIALREQYFAAKKSVERPTTEPVAAPLFEGKKSTTTAVDAYTKVADRFTRQS